MHTVECVSYKLHPYFVTYERLSGQDFGTAHLIVNQACRLAAKVCHCQVLCLPFQVEFSYPPLVPGESHDSKKLPEEWKYLPFLALPDGAHNYQEGEPNT